MLNNSSLLRILSNAAPTVYYTFPGKDIHSPKVLYMRYIRMSSPLREYQSYKKKNCSTIRQRKLEGNKTMSNNQGHTSHDLPSYHDNCDPDVMF